MFRKGSTRYEILSAMAIALTMGVIGCGLGMMAAPKPKAPPPQIVVVPDDQVTKGLRLFGDEQDAVVGNLDAGWVQNDAEVKAVVDTLEFKSFGETPAGRAVMADTDDVFLWDAARMVTGDVLPPRDQLDVGSCVAFGNAHAVETLLLVQIAEDKKAGRRPKYEFKAICQEALYALSRVEVGGGKIRGDGSVGAWATAALKKYGALARGKYGNYDLTNYDTRRCRDWGRAGCPDELEAISREFIVQEAVLAKSFDEAAKAIRQGYPIAVCSNQGFAQTRDADGFAAAQGSWAHCMAATGVRGGNRPGIFIQNSWGNRYHRGPKGIGNPPDGGFWCEPRVFDAMCKRGEAWCFSNFKGFPQRKMDWFARTAPATPKAPHFDLTNPRTVAALRGKFDVPSLAH